MYALSDAASDGIKIKFLLMHWQRILKVVLISLDKYISLFTLFLIDTKLDIAIS